MSTPLDRYRDTLVGWIRKAHDQKVKLSRLGEDWDAIDAEGRALAAALTAFDEAIKACAVFVAQVPPPQTQKENR